VRGLTGKCVIVTRAAGQAAEFEELLQREGAAPYRVPAIAFVPPENWAPVDRALAQLDTYDWVILTSANAVDAFWNRMETTGAKPGRARYAAVGPATAARLARRNGRVDLVPAEPSAGEELLAALEAHIPLAGCRFLFPRAEEGRDILPEGLRKAGAEVDLITVYRTVPSEEGREALQALLSGGQKADWVTFASGSAVRGFLALGGPETVLSWMRENRVKVASIGHVTDGVLQESGLEVTVSASYPGPKGMIEAMKRHEREVSHD
jgi:uroporphyrinogen III methyltransferase / synthase